MGLMSRIITLYCFLFWSVRKNGWSVSIRITKLSVSPWWNALNHAKGNVWVEKLVDEEV